MVDKRGNIMDYNNEIEEMERLRQIVLAITERREIDINFTENEGGPTAYISHDVDTIVINNAEIPEAVKKNSVLLSRARAGLTVHEAGHGKWTKDWMDILEVISKGKEPWLVKNIKAIVSDKVVNSNIRANYSHNFGNYLDFILNSVGRSFLEDLGGNLEKKDDQEKVFSVLSAISLKGLYDIEPDEKIMPEDDELRSKMEDVVEKCCEHLEEVEYTTSKDRFAKSINKIYDEVFQFLVDVTNDNDSSDKKKKGMGGNKGDKKQSPGGKKGDKKQNQPGSKGNKKQNSLPSDTKSKVQDKLPVNLNGNMNLEGEETAKELEDEMDSGEKEGGEEKDEENNDNNKNLTGISAGSGSGLRVPHPKPNFSNYKDMVNDNYKEIKRLLNLLKQTRTFDTKKKSFVKHGRFMSEVSAQFQASSYKRPVQHMNEKKKKVIEENNPAIGLIVDLSGSMNLSKAKDALTIIAETCRDWLKDNELAIEVFGANYQRIKAFVESDRVVGGRIGGIETGSKEGQLNARGTVLNKPLREMQKMMNGLGLSERGKKFIVIVSDFQLTDSGKKKVKKIIKECQRDMVEVIGVGLCNSDLQEVQKFIKDENATYVDGLENLPDKFFEIYQKASGVDIKRRGF